MEAGTGQGMKRGRAYRRYGCKGTHGKQFGAWCMRLLEDAGHGTWTYAGDLAPEDGRRPTRRRGGFAGHAAAAREIGRVLDRELRGVYEDRSTTVAALLREWWVIHRTCGPRRRVT